MNTKERLITIVVPCYNQGNFLDECLSSVHNQSNTNWECIIVDDGSTDETKNKAQEWVNKDDRFSYLYKKNGGLSSARNFGIDRSSGKYILPLDADDKIHKDLVFEFFKIVQTSLEPDLVYFDVEFFGAKRGLYKLPEYDYKVLLTQNCFISGSIFAKKLWYISGGYDTSLEAFEDWDFWIRSLSPESRVVKIEKELYYYRKSQTGTITSEFVKNPALYYNLYKKIYLKNIELYFEYFPNPIEVFKENRELREFNLKIKNSGLFKAYHFLKKQINAFSRSPE